MIISLTEPDSASEQRFRGGSCGLTVSQDELNTLGRKIFQRRNSELIDHADLVLERVVISLQKHRQIVNCESSKLALGVSLGCN